MRGKRIVLRISCGRRRGLQRRMMRMAMGRRMLITTITTRTISKKTTRQSSGQQGTSGPIPTMMTTLMRWHGPPQPAIIVAKHSMSKNSLKLKPSCGPAAAAPQRAVSPPATLSIREARAHTIKNNNRITMTMSTTMTMAAEIWRTEQVRSPGCPRASGAGRAQEGEHLPSSLTLSSEGITIALISYPRLARQALRAVF